VNFDFMRRTVEKRQTFDRLSQTSHPIEGYFGTLTAQNDIELLQHCAENMKDVTFVFAGKITAGHYSELAQMKNVMFLGWVPYEEIASLCATFDVCMLAWKMNKWIASCNPFKFMEYMASGKPIVSVPIRELMQYADVISIANSKEEFCSAIRWELNNDNDKRARLRIEIAKKHSWENQIERLSQIVTDAIATKTAE
jgi:glycosyltransferase involved in cell wall biosynthesis